MAFSNLLLFIFIKNFILRTIANDYFVASKLIKSSSQKFELGTVETTKGSLLLVVGSFQIKTLPFNYLGPNSPGRFYTNWNQVVPTKQSSATTIVTLSSSGKINLRRTIKARTLTEIKKLRLSCYTRFNRRNIGVGLSLICELAASKFGHE